MLLRKIITIENQYNNMINTKIIIKFNFHFKKLILF